MMAARQELARLQRHWHARLKAEGFVDIEDVGVDGEPMMLVRRDGRHDVDAGSRFDDYESVTEYYSACGEFLHGYAFASELDRSVWELHCDGSSYRETAKVCGVSTRIVWRTVNRLLAVMRSGWVAEPVKRFGPLYEAQETTGRGGEEEAEDASENARKAQEYGYSREAEIVRHGRNSHRAHRRHDADADFRPRKVG